MLWSTVSYQNICLQASDASRRNFGKSDSEPIFMREIQFQTDVVANLQTAKMFDSSAHLSFNHQIYGEKISHGKYMTRFAETSEEISAAFRLQYEVFNLELNVDFIAPTPNLSADDLLTTNCLYLLVIEQPTEKIVGTYRINSLEMAKHIDGFSSSGEFHLKELPTEFLAQSIEISRLCISPEHRNKQVLFLLWKGLATYLTQMQKRYVFGCCSIFSQDYGDAVEALYQLENAGHFHEKLRVSACQEFLFTAEEKIISDSVGELKLPKLFDTYLRLGAKVCSQPAIDRSFKTIDFFMIFDVEAMPEKYYKLFFA